MKKNKIIIISILIIAIIIFIFVLNQVLASNHNLSIQNSNLTNQVITNTNNLNNSFSFTSSQSEQNLLNNDEKINTNNNSNINDINKNIIPEADLEQDNTNRNVVTSPSTDLNATELKNATNNFIDSYFLSTDQLSRKQSISSMLDLDYIKKNPDSIFSYDINHNYNDSLLITSDKYFISRTDSMVDCNYRNGGKTQVGITYQRTYIADDSNRTLVTQTITEYYSIMLSNNYKIQDARFINSQVINTQ